MVVLLKNATHIMKTKVDGSSTSVVSGGELFLRFITLASKAIEDNVRREAITVDMLKNLAVFITLVSLFFAQDFEKAREIMLERGEIFITKLKESRPKIATLATQFIKGGAVTATEE